MSKFLLLLLRMKGVIFNLHSFYKYLNEAMNLKNLKIGTCAILIYCFIFGCRFLSLNEKEILRDSKSAFVYQKFRDEPFREVNDISDFSAFLLRNCDTLLAYHQHIGFKQFKMTEGSYSSFEKKHGECFTFIDTNQIFMDYYVPHFLKDSIDKYLLLIGDKLIPSFTLCPKNNYATANDSNCSLVLHLKYRKDKINDPHYSLQHFIYSNRKEQNAENIQSIWEVLQKDTVLKGDLRYAIRVIPYHGL